MRRALLAGAVGLSLGWQVVQPYAGRALQVHTVLADGRSILNTSADMWLMYLMHLLSLYPQSSLCVDAETEELDTECRRAQLAGDARKLSDYGSVSNRQMGLAGAGLVPVAELNDAYSVATTKLGSEIESYISTGEHPVVQGQVVDHATCHHIKNSSLLLSLHTTTNS